MSCARVKTYTAAKIGASERHNERKNKDYGNVNVDPERIPFNVHFKDPGNKSYMDVLREKENAGELSRRGLRSDAVLFDELIFDVNTMYFEQNGGYEYAIEFYQEAYRYASEKYGEENIISAVMHADEINKAASEELGRPIYHYHMHLVAFPVVDKEVRWSKRCKDPALVGTIKEVVHQISHSKKWESKIPVLDDNGEPVIRKNGKPKYKASYSVLQDEFYNHMTENGYKGFQRGREGSTTEHLSSLEYQIEKDKTRLSELEEKIMSAEIEYESADSINKTFNEIENAGKKNAITGNYSVPKEDYKELTELAKEGISSRGEIKKLKRSLSYYKDLANRLQRELNNLRREYNRIVEVCKPFLYAIEHFPETVMKFKDKVKELFSQKEAQEKQRELFERKKLETKQKPHNRDWDYER